MLIPNKIVHFNNIGLFYALLPLTIPIIAIETADTFPADFLHNPHKKNIVQKKQSNHLRLLCLRIYFCNLYYSARNVKRWKPVAVSSLSKPFKKSATEIFSFWQ